LLERQRAIPHGSLMIVGGMFVIMFLLLLVAWTCFQHRSWGLLVLLIGVEMIAGIQFTQWRTTLGSATPAELKERISQLPAGPVVPRMHAMRNNADDSQVMHLLWRNTQTFQGWPSHGGFNSFWLAAHHDLTDSFPALHSAMLDQPIVYLADTLLTRDEVRNGCPEAPAVLEGRSPFRGLKGEGSLVPVDASFEHLTLHSFMNHEGFMVVQQNRYPGWRITVDGQEVPIVPVNVAAFGAWLPKGDHRIELRYHKPVLRILLWVSHGVFFLLVFLLSWSSERRTFHMVAASILLLAWCWSMLAHAPKQQRMDEGWQDVLAALPRTDHVLAINTDRGPGLVPSGGLVMRMDLPDDIGPLEKALEGPVVPLDTLVMAWHGLPISPAARALLAHNGWRHVESHGNKAAGSMVLVHDEEALEWQVLHEDPMEGGLALHVQGMPWGPAWRRNIGQLLAEAEGLMIMDLYHRGSGSGDARLVIERRRHDVITDHETIPLGPSDTLRWHHFMAVRSLPHRRFAAEELGVYVLSTGGDTVWVKDLRVRHGKLPF
jgi:hypothetical protein